MNNCYMDLRVLGAMIRRDIYVLKKKLRDAFINGVIQLGTNIIIFGYLFPLMGMPATLIAPMFCSILIFMIFHQAWSATLAVLNDLQAPRLIEYYLILPISKQLLMVAYVLRLSAEIIIATLPLALIGMVILGSMIKATILKLIFFLFFYCICVIWCTMLFLFFCFWHTRQWQLEHIWPRRASPLIIFSAAQFPWKLMYAFSPWIGIAFLCNPLTYTAEGLRSALLADDSISLSICCLVLCTTGALLAKGIMYALKKRLDPV